MSIAPPENGLKARKTEAGNRPAAETDKVDPGLLELKKEAALARAAAEEAIALAQAKIKAANAYLSGYKEKSRRQRRRYYKTAQQAAQEAREARERADAAIARSNRIQAELNQAVAGRLRKLD